MSKPVVMITGGLTGIGDRESQPSGRRSRRPMAVGEAADGASGRAGDREQMPGTLVYEPLLRALPPLM